MIIGLGTDIIEISRIQKVNKDIFILAPSNIELDGLRDELQNKGMFPW